MDASTVQEIAKQLGIAANNVGELVTDLLPQYIVYNGLDIAVRALFSIAAMLLVVGVIYTIFRSDLASGAYDIEEAADITKRYNKWLTIVAVFFVVFIVAISAMKFAQVCAAPKMAIVNYLLQK